jgi:hypothetical protein
LKPYLYILAILLVGAVGGFFIGQRTSHIERVFSPAAKSGQDDQQLIRRILVRQAEAYRLHDAVLLLRDCSNTYVEVDGNTGESMSLGKTLMWYHEQFRSNDGITFEPTNITINLQRNFALMRANYSKTSESYEQQGIKGYNGEGVWLLSRLGGSWHVDAFCHVENARE